MIIAKILITAKDRDKLIEAVEQAMRVFKGSGTDIAYNCNVITEDVPFSITIDSEEERCKFMIGGRCHHEDFLHSTCDRTIILCSTDECPLVK